MIEIPGGVADGVAVEGVEDEKTALALIRRARELARVLVLNGTPPDRARALTVDRAGAGIPDGDHPAFAFARSALARAVDREIFQAVAQLNPES